MGNKTDLERLTALETIMDLRSQQIKECFDHLNKRFDEFTKHISDAFSKTSAEHHEKTESHITNTEKIIGLFDKRVKRLERGLLAVFVVLSLLFLFSVLEEHQSTKVANAMRTIIIKPSAN
jgi:hypothetical protein